MQLSVYERNDLLVQLTVSDETGAALDLTGATLVFVIATRFGVEVIRKTTGDGITVTDAPGGRAEIHLTAQDLDVPATTYRTELLVIDAAGHRYTASTGEFTVQQSLIE